jgi:hypothetical protein
LAWAVPALIPTTPATLPNSSTIVANPTISRFINLGLFSTATARVQEWRLIAGRLGGGCPLPSIDVADALLDERRELDRKLTGS